MKFRKIIILLSLVVASLGTSCTTRYQDMLRDRDNQIQALNGDVSRLRGENEELRNRIAARPGDQTVSPVKTTLFRFSTPQPGAWSS